MLAHLRVLVLVLVAVGVIVSGTNVAANASPTSPVSTPLPTADPCATAIPELPNDLPSAFAYEVKSAAVLHFPSQLKRVPEREQAQIFERAVAAVKTPGQHDVERAEQRVCPTLEEIYAKTRALALIANEWTPRGLHDNDKFSAFAEVVGDAITALAMSDAGELTADLRQAALHSFDALADLPAAVRVHWVGADECEQPETTIYAAPPTYPPVAAISGTTGVVNILVSLNEQGDIRMAKPLSNTLGDRPGADELVKAALVAAAASTFAPRIRNCQGVPGRYVFAVGFNR
jgi:hypothetical protein